MGSNFGGDGGDTLADPANGCNIAEEYVYLRSRSPRTARSTNVSHRPLDRAPSTTSPPNDGATATPASSPRSPPTSRTSNTWVAGGQHVWVQTHGYAIRSRLEWTDVYDLGAGQPRHGRRRLGRQGLRGLVRRRCNSQGFSPRHRGRQRRRHRLAPADTCRPTARRAQPLPVAASPIDPKNANHVYLAVNGFSRHWTEGPGAGIGHVFESHDGGTTWKDISANLPDVPADSVDPAPARRHRAGHRPRRVLPRPRTPRAGARRATACRPTPRSS